MRGVAPYADERAPDLVLLDWNLPKVTGPEVLQARMNDVRMRAIPVVVFTGSNDRTDERIARELGADDFFVKPLDFTLYLKQVQTILTRALLLHQYDRSAPSPLG